MSTTLAAALADPILLMLAGPHLGALSEPDPTEIAAVLAVVGRMSEREIEQARRAWAGHDQAGRDLAHDLFVAGAGAQGADPLAAGSLFDALEAAWPG